MVLLPNAPPASHIYASVKWSQSAVQVNFMQDEAQASHWGLLSMTQLLGSRLLRGVLCNCFGLLIFQGLKPRLWGVLKALPPISANILFLAELVQVLFPPWSPLPLKPAFPPCSEPAVFPQVCPDSTEQNTHLNLHLDPDICSAGTWDTPQTRPGRIWEASILIEVSSMEGAFAVFPSSEPGWCAGLKG